jgi:hypothetical protein
MEEEKHNSQIEKIAKMLEHDSISPDEQDIKKLQKYKNQIMLDCNLSEDDSMNIVYESLLFLKLKNSSSLDPIQQGDQFGAGFS